MFTLELASTLNINDHQNLHPSALSHSSTHGSGSSRFKATNNVSTKPFIFSIFHEQCQPSGSTHAFGGAFSSQQWHQPRMGSSTPRVQAPEWQPQQDHTAPRQQQRAHFALAQPPLATPRHGVSRAAFTPTAEPFVPGRSRSNSPPSTPDPAPVMKAKSSYVSNGTVFFPQKAKGGAPARHYEREAVISASNQRVFILPNTRNVESWGDLVQVVG